MPALLLALFSCAPGQVAVLDAPLVLSVHGPDYGAFVGDTARVVGQVSPASAVVTVENRRVNVGSDGSFAVEVPMAGPYRNLDVRAFHRQDRQRERIPVFAGQDPQLTWPGGLGVRVTPRALDAAGASLGAALDASGWQAQLLAALPAVDQPGFRLVPVDLTHRPTELTLVPDADGLALQLQIRDLTVWLDAGFALGDTWFDVPSRAGFEAVRVRARLGIGATDGAPVLQLAEPQVELVGATIQLGAFEGDALEPALQGIGDLLAGLGDQALGALVDGLSALPPGQPLDLTFDLLGQPVQVQLAGLGTDAQGVWAELGVGIGGPPPDPLQVHRPDRDAGGPGADLVVAVHEGLLAPLAQSSLVELLAQDLQLSGLLGTGLGWVIRGLPGGEHAPEADGWCVRVQPGQARAVRMGQGALATLYLPDLQLQVGVSHAGLICDPWLSASLAVELGITVRDGALSLDLVAPDGAVGSYAAPGAYDEAELVAGLGGLLDLISALVGGAVDLGDLLGEGLRVVEVRPIPGHEGLVAVGLDLP